MATSWEQSHVFPIIARVIADTSAARTDYVSAREIAELLLKDPEGRAAIESARPGLPERSDQWIASNMVAWFGQRITTGQSDWAGDFERVKVRGVWAYKGRV